MSPTQKKKKPFSCLISTGCAQGVEASPYPFHKTHHASRAWRWLLQPLQSTPHTLLSSAELAQMGWAPAAEAHNVLQGGPRRQYCLNVTWRATKTLASHHLGCGDCSPPSKGTTKGQRGLQVGPAPGPAARWAGWGWGTSLRKRTDCIGKGLWGLQTCQIIDISAGLKGKLWSWGTCVGLVMCTGSRGLGLAQRGCEAWVCVCICVSIWPGESHSSGWGGDVCFCKVVGYFLRCGWAISYPLYYLLIV